MKYDFLIVGSGLTGAIIAHEARKRNKRVLVIEKRSHIGGNIYTENIKNIPVHVYGAHIFHTNDKRAWDYINNFSEFNRFTNSPVANYNGEIYSLPFNMYTFNKIWGVTTPAQAREKIEEQKKSSGITNPSNLEEQAISLVGRDIYEILIKGYTEKQWGRPCSELPAFIIKRLPVRFTYDNNYFNARYQGIPVNGYTEIINKMLEGVEVKTNCDFMTAKHEFESLAEKIFYTGAIDEYFNYSLGTLEYRTLKFEQKIFDELDNFQGNAVMNFTDSKTPYTRQIEHKHFYPGLETRGTVVTREYSSKWSRGDEPYYPVNDSKNNSLYEKYKALADSQCPNVIFCGRLGEYKYYDMDAIVLKAMYNVEYIV